MSTKIYYAWRVPIDKLNDFIDFVRPQVYETAQNIIAKLMPDVTKEHIEKVKLEKPYLPEAMIRFSSAIELCKSISKQSGRAPGVDVDFALNVWLYENHAYIIPIGEYKDFKVPDFAEDFSYWNNTDQPDNITDEQWEEKCKTWEQINLGEGLHSHNARRLEHNVINLSMPYGDFDFEWEMEQRLVRRDTKQQESGDI
jgi:hypothetical protein